MGSRALSPSQGKKLPKGCTWLPVSSLLLPQWPSSHGIQPDLGSSMLAFCCVTCNRFLSLSELCFRFCLILHLQQTLLAPCPLLRTRRVGGELSYYVQSCPTMCRMVTSHIQRPRHSLGPQWEEAVNAHLWPSDPCRSTQSCYGLPRGSRAPALSCPHW